MTLLGNKILQCTIRKSKDVANKVVKSLTILVAVIFGGFFAIAGIVGICEFASPIVYTGVSAIEAVLFAIPWWVYASALAILAIPLYSFLWCLKRELKDEDYSKESADIFIAFGLTALIFEIGWGIAHCDSKDIGIVWFWMFCVPLTILALGIVGTSVHYYGIAVWNCYKRLQRSTP